MTGEAKEIAEAAFQSLSGWNLDIYESLLHDDAVEGRPQLREQFVGLQNIMGMYRSFPMDPPTIEWARIRGGGDIWVGEGIIDYGTGDPTDRLVALLQIDGKKIRRADYYFASHLDPIPYHAGWSEPDL